MSERDGIWLECLLLTILTQVTYGWLRIAWFVAWCVTALRWILAGMSERYEKRARR